MNRLPQLYAYYRTVQRNQLQQHWTELLDLTANSGASSFLRDFYDHLFGHWQRQLKWCSSVFGSDHAQEPTQVLCESLVSLQPTRETAVTSCLKRTNDKLAVLQEISAANGWFGQVFVDHFGKADLVPIHVGKSIFDWFAVFVAQYASMEQSHMGSALAELNLVHATTGESVRALGNANGKVIGWFEEALGRCDSITQMCGLPALVIVFNVRERERERDLSSKFYNLLRFSVGHSQNLSGQVQKSPTATPGQSNHRAELVAAAIVHFAAQQSRRFRGASHSAGATHRLHCPGQTFDAQR